MNAQLWQLHSWLTDRVWNLDRRIGHRYQVLDPEDRELARIQFEQDMGAGLGRNRITWQDRITDTICNSLCAYFGGH